MDAVVDIVNGRVGYGAVIHNKDGCVMGVGVDQGVFSNDVDTAKAKAFYFGIQLTSETHFISIGGGVIFIASYSICFRHMSYKYKVILNFLRDIDANFSATKLQTSAYSKML